LAELSCIIWLGLGSKKAIAVTGSDDEIYEPSRTRLEKAGILPAANMGIVPEKITKNWRIILGCTPGSIIPEAQKATRTRNSVYSFSGIHSSMQSQHKKKSSPLVVPMGRPR